MTTILEVNAQGHWHDFVCIHYTILRLRDDRTIRVGCNAWGKQRSSCFQRFLPFIWHANFWLLFELDTCASTHSRDLLPHTRGANGFRHRGRVVPSFSARWRQAESFTQNPFLLQIIFLVFFSHRLVRGPRWYRRFFVYDGYRTIIIGQLTNPTVSFGSRVLTPSKKKFFFILAATSIVYAITLFYYLPVKKLEALLHTSTRSRSDRIQVGITSRERLSE